MVYFCSGAYIMLYRLLPHPEKYGHGEWVEGR
jgi:hypothetical protein